MTCFREKAVGYHMVPEPEVPGVRARSDGPGHHESLAQCPPSSLPTRHPPPRLWTGRAAHGAAPADRPAGAIGDEESVQEIGRASCRERV